MIFQLLIVNVNLKKAVWDDLSRDNVQPLLLRVLQGTVGTLINFSAAKYIPMTIISVVNSMSPLITIVLAFLILKDKIKTFEAIMLFLLIIGIVVVVTGEQPDETDDDEELSSVLKYFIWGALLLEPFLDAGNAIVMRKMKKFHVAVISWYVNLGMFFTYLIFAFALGDGV